MPSTATTSSYMYFCSMGRPPSPPMSVVQLPRVSGHMALFNMLFNIQIHYKVNISQVMKVLQNISQSGIRHMSHSEQLNAVSKCLMCYIQYVEHCISNQLQKYQIKARSNHISSLNIHNIPEIASAQSSS